MAVGLLFLVLGVGMVWMADDFGSEARRLPFVVGIPLVLLAIANLGVIAARIVRDRKSVGDEPRAMDEDAAATAGEGVPGADVPDGEEDAAPNEDDGIPLGWTLMTLAGLVVTFYFTGLVLTAILFTAVFMRVAGHAKWRKIGIVVAVLLGAIYLFTNVLEVTIYDGWLIEEEILPGFFTF